MRLGLRLAYSAFSAELFLIINLSAILISAQNPSNLLTVQQCITIALKESPYTTRATGDHLQYRYQRFSSLSSVLPSFQFNTEYNRSPQQEIVDFPVVNPDVAGTPLTLDQLEIAFTLNQSIIDVASWGQLKQAFIIADAAKATYRGGLAELAYNVKQSYYELIRLYRNLSVLQASVEQNTKQLQVAQERFKLGSIARPELLRIQVEQSQLRVNLIEATSKIEIGRKNLANYMGISYPVQIDTFLQFPDTTHHLPSEDSLIGLLYIKNPSLITSKLTLDAQKSNQFSIKMQKIPILNGYYSFGYSGPRFSNLDNFWILGVQLNWPILEGLAWYGRIKEAQAQTATAMADMEIAKNTAEEQMHQAYSSLRSNRQSLSLVSLLIEQAKEQFRLREEQYRLGATSSEELLNSLVSLREAQQQVVQIVTGYYLAQAQILNLLGEW